MVVYLYVCRTEKNVHLLYVVRLVIHAVLASTLLSSQQLHSTHDKTT